MRYADLTFPVTVSTASGCRRNRVRPSPPMGRDSWPWAPKLVEDESH